MNQDELLKSIHERLEAMGEETSEERIKQLVSESLVDLMQDEDNEFVRKMRFGGAEERKLIGTKFSRWGLNTGDVEYLYDLISARKEAGIGPGPSEELTKTFEAISEAYYLPMDQVRAIDQQAIENLFPRIPLALFNSADRALAERGAFEKTGAYQRAVRAMDTAESGYGSQLVGAQYVGELWEAARRESRVFALIPSFEMTQPTAYLPVEADLPEMLFVAENTSATASDYTTSKSGSQRVQVDAKKMLIHQIWSGEMDEDSLLPFVPFVRRQAILSVAYYGDSLVLNGDDTNAGTGNINLDDADPADTKHYLGFDGIRHAALVDNTANATDAAAAVSLAKLNDMRALMIDSSYLMDWGHPTNKQDLVYVSDPWTADKICLLDEVTTIDKYGPAATVLNGEVSKLFGHPHVGAMAMGKTEADGKISTTGGNNVKGQVALFNRRGFAVGWRRRIKVEVERLPARDQTRLVHSLRLGFGRYTPTGAASGIECAAVLYDITV